MCKTTLFIKSMRLTFLLLVLNSYQTIATEFTDVVENVTPAVVAIGLYTPIENSGNQVLGTGFVVADGKHAVTNYHVVSKILDPQIVQHYVVITGKGRNIQAFKATVLEIDPLHDLALLEFNGSLPSATLAVNTMLKPGTDVAFTGFPIGAAIGIYPATHRGMISAITPDAIPAQNANQLTSAMLNRLNKPEMVYQLDATAYPGNSGSPVYSVEKGEVVGVINKVFVSQGKESALSAPSGISYAIPVKHVNALLRKRNL
ncbi:MULTISPECIES: S1 family peptidase [unclassified Alteromonas]|uniref:S1 family peptidase n=1 Tax=unclassified Alteromonas TaxID=2614992 RepID=UPI0005097FE4|nr:MULTISPECIES: serine protease [unclassified Alteromonas]